MTNPDYRAMCAELLAAIQLYTQLNPAASDMSASELTEKLMDAMAATVAALAQPEAEVPTDEELETFLVDVACQNGDMYYADPKVLARAVLARWGRPAAPPVAEDVAELVEWLLLIAGSDNSYSHARLTRAATLLQQLSAPANALPLPVGESNQGENNV